MNTVDFEEIALQSVNPPLGFNDPKPSDEVAIKEWEDKFMVSIPQTLKHKEFDGVLIQIPFFHSSSLVSPDLPLLELRERIKSRIPIHRRGLTIWGIATPILAPLGIIRTY